MMIGLKIKSYAENILTINNVSEKLFNSREKPEAGILVLLYL
jgi:hypothetical protein